MSKKVLRESSFKLYMTEKEFETLKDKASKLGLNVSDYLRFKAIYCK